MDKRYQGVIRRRKSMKDRQNNGQKIPGVIRSVVFFVFRFISPLDILFAILASFPVNYLQYTWFIRQLF